MRIGIEAQRLFRLKKHGMDHVALELIKNLQIIDKENEYFIFVKPNHDRACLSESSNFHIIELNGISYPFWEQWVLPHAAKKYKCDVLHCTSNTGPIFTKIPILLTLHDIIYLEKSSIFNTSATQYQRFGNMYRRWIVPTVVRKASQIITVSDFENNQITSYFNFLKNKVKTIYNGVNAHFEIINDKEQLTYVKTKYRLPDKFFFFLGNTDPKKNTPGVLKAFSLFNQQSKIKYNLVMLDYNEKALMKILYDIGFPEIRPLIHLTGYIKNNEMPAIINQCAVFLYPSLRESFGIPLLEGMACGKPVITSNTSSMPEVAGEAAIFVDPTNAEEISQAIQTLLNSPKLQQDLIEKGLNRSKMFTWHNMAVNVLDQYKKIVLTSN